MILYHIKFRFATIIFKNAKIRVDKLSKAKYNVSIATEKDKENSLR